MDIGRLDEVTRAQFNTRLVTHLQVVRGQTDTLIGAIVPSPFATDPGNNWAGFPWSAVGGSADVVIPMALWSFRDGCPGTEVCAFTSAQVYQWVRDQTQRARSLTGLRVRRQPRRLRHDRTEPLADPRRPERLVTAARPSPRRR